MESTPSEEGVVAADFAKLENERALLAHTEGFGKLSPEQQRIIELSLYTQKRAERTTDPSSTAAQSERTTVGGDTVTHIRSVPYFSDGTASARAYAKSQDHIAHFFCHAAVANVEEGTDLPSEPTRYADSFYDANFRDVQSVDDARAMIEQFGFPAVVLIQLPNDEYTNRGIWHSMIALGHNADGDIIVWEKMNLGLPYRLTTLTDVYRSYPNYPRWGIRSVAAPPPVTQ